MQTFKMKTFIFCFWILCISETTEAQKTTKPTIAKTVEARNMEFCKIIEEQSFQKLTDLYTQDCWIMLPDARILCGPDATMDYVHYLKKQVRFKSVRIISIDVFGNDKSIITESGFYHWLDSDGVSFDDGKYMVVWKNEGGVWKRHREIFSSSHEIRN